MTNPPVGDIIHTYGRNRRPSNDRSKGNDDMQKLAMILCALSVMLMCAVPALAAGANPQTSDSAIKIVLIALVIAILAIVITLIFTRKKK